MLGVYPAQGCPYRCNFCSVVKIAGRLERTPASLRAAKAAGVRLIMFTSDNFNKYPEAPRLHAMIDERIDLPFFVQSDTQIGRQPDLMELLQLAGCWPVFLGIESLDRQTLKDVHKHRNRCLGLHAPAARARRLRPGSTPPRSNPRRGPGRSHRGQSVHPWPPPLRNCAGTR
jgi:hypothetical protein